MIDFTKACRNPRLVKGMIGLSMTEFNRLLPAFTRCEAEAKARKEAARTTQRQRGPGGGRKGSLKTPADRLLFILFYFKVYPTQDVMAVVFGNTQAWACKWVHWLIPVLETTLGRKLELPAREPVGSMAALRKVCPALCFYIDGTDRPVVRPRVSELQRELYSGKKKRHSVKNTVVTIGREGRVVFLGPTRSGRVHDKTAAEDDGIHWPKGSVTFADSGYQGYNPTGVVMLRPKKKPHGGTLSKREKAMNRRLSAARVSVEHALSGVKRSRIVHDIFRGRRPGLRDRVMLLATGLHNFRVTHRHSMRK